MTMIIHAGIALVDADFPPRSDFAVCVDGNRIAATGSLAELRARYPDAEQIGGNNLVMVPAFIDSHDHGRGLGTTKLGIPDDMLEVWILGLWSQPTIDPYLTAAYDALLLLRSGVGTVAHSANPRNWILQGEESEAGIRAYQEAGIRVAYQPIQIDQNTLVSTARRNSWPASRPKPGKWPCHSPGRQAWSLRTTCRCARIYGSAITISMSTWFTSKSVLRADNGAAMS